MIGDVIFVQFPLADQASFKQRPCLVISEADSFGDFEVMKITSKRLDAKERVRLDPQDFLKGRLNLPSAVVPADCAKTNVAAVTQYVGQISPEKVRSLLKTRITGSTRSFSRFSHKANLPGDNPERPAFVPGETTVPYAGRVFTEEEVEAAVGATLDFWLTLGPEGEAFEKELASFLGVKHSLLVNSGSSANLIALSCLTTHKLPDHKRIRPGDEVITCAAGFPTTVAPILQNACIPVFIDNDPATGNARVDQLENAYSPGKTKAVMMAHTLGNPFNISAILAFCKKYDLWLIEDNCDALGCTYSMPVETARELGLDHLLRQAEAKTETLKQNNQEPRTNNQELLSAFPRIQDGLLTAYTGSFGDLSTQSFYPPHHLTMGEGGAVNIIRKPALKTYAESFRDWGRDCWCPSGKDNTCGKRFGWNLGELPKGYDHKYIYSHLGYNLKPLDPQAAIGRVQLKKLPSFIDARKQNWEILRRGLADLEFVFDFSLPTHATGWKKAEKLKIEKLKIETLKQNNEEPRTKNPEQISASQRLSISAFSWDDTQCQTDCSWFGFMLRVKPTAPFSATDLASHLDTNRIGNRMLFGGNLLRQPVFVQLRKDRPESFRVTGDLQGADALMNEAIFLGTYPGLSQSQLDYEIAVIRDFVALKQES